MLLMLSS